MTTPDQTTTNQSGVFSADRAGVDTTPSGDAAARLSGVDSAADRACRSGESTYTVEEGDTLAHIAKRFYGQANQWDAIYQANRDRIDHPDMITPGQVLRIPPSEERDAG